MIPSMIQPNQVLLGAGTEEDVKRDEHDWERGVLVYKCT